MEFWGVRSGVGLGDILRLHAVLVTGYIRTQPLISLLTAAHCTSSVDKWLNDSSSPKYPR